MADVYDCSDSSQLLSGTRSARQALGRGQVIVMPTDTVYGIAADAFTPEAVQRLLDAKGRGRQSPPPVLIPGVDTLNALAAEVPQPVTALAEAFWPGPLTVVLRANPSLSWDLGDTGGTVALRIPNDPLALELLRETGPLAVSSANKTGEPAARTAKQAEEMLGDSVAVYLEAGESDGDGTASTIVDATHLTDEGGTLRILRDGGVSREKLAELLPQVTILNPGEPLPEEETQDPVEGERPETEAAGEDVPAAPAEAMSAEATPAEAQSAEATPADAETRTEPPASANEH